MLWPDFEATVTIFPKQGWHAKAPVVAGLQNIHRIEAVQAGVVVVRDELRKVRGVPALHCDPCSHCLSSFM